MSRPKPPHVTVHALRRFLERAEGITTPRAIKDADVVADHAALVEQREIVRHLAEVVARGVALGASAVIYRGHRYILKGRDIITILDVKTSRRRRGRRIVDRAE